MATAEVQSGLEGVVAFATEIAEPDKEGGSLRYRGVDIDDLVGKVPFEKVWGLLVDGSFEPGMPPAVPYPIPLRTGNTRVDVQSALAQLAPAWGFRELLDISDEEARDNLARSSVMALSFVAQSARGTGRLPVPEKLIDEADDDSRALPPALARRGRPGSRQGDRRLLDLGGRARHERLHLHGARGGLTGADVAAALSAAVGALSGPLHGGAPSRVLTMLDDVEKTGDAEKCVKDAARPRRAADGLRASRVPRGGPARSRAAPHRRARSAPRVSRWRRRSRTPRSPS